MVDLGDALGVLLIGSLFVVVFWRVLKPWLDAKNGRFTGRPWHHQGVLRVLAA